MTAAEKDVLQRIAARGWTVLRDGWPDALCVAEDGWVIAVEVKRHLNDPLRPSQAEMHRALGNAGIEVVVATADVWRPTRAKTDGVHRTFAMLPTYQCEHEQAEDVIGPFYAESGSSPPAVQ